MKAKKFVPKVEVDISKSLNFMMLGADYGDKDNKLGGSLMQGRKKGLGPSSPSKSRLAEIISTSDRKKVRPKY